METAASNSAKLTLHLGSGSAVVPLTSVSSLADVRALIAEKFGLQQGYSVVDGERADVSDETLQARLASKSDISLIVQSESEKTQGGPAIVRESIYYVPHPHALTESGRSHFNRISDAISELIDNSIQATDGNDDARQIKVQVVAGNSHKESFLLVWDNGCGMDRDTINAFAKYYYGQEQRQKEVPSSADGAMPDFHNTSYISRFGVGAKQSSFYLGERVHLITKTRASQSVLEFTIDRDKLDERHKKNEAVFVDTVTYRAVGDSSLLDPTELRAQPIRDAVEQEQLHEQFTLLIIHLHHEKYERMISNGAAAKIAHELAHTYHYFLHPTDSPDIVYARLAKNPEEPRNGVPNPPIRPVQKVRQIPSNIFIEYSMTKLDGTPRFRWRLNNLQTIDKLYLDPTLALHAYRFVMEVPHPDAVTEERVVEAGFTQNDQATATVKEMFKVLGIVYYYPRRRGKLFRPTRADWLRLLEETENIEPALRKEMASRSSSSSQMVVKEERDGRAADLDDEDDEDLDIQVDIVDEEREQKRDDAAQDDGAFDIYWQRRLVPQSTVKRLPFFPIIRSYADAERLNVPENYLDRLKGVLFFPWDFPVTNNKLQLQAEPNINDWLNNETVSKHILFDDRDIKKSFQEWLKCCHLHFDQEHRFVGRLPPASPVDPFARFQSVVLGDSRFTQGELLRLRFRETIFARVVEFRTAPLEAQQAEYHGAGELVYVREPEQLYGSTLQAVDIGRIDVTGSPVDPRELAPFIKKLPKTIKLWFDMDRFESEQRDLAAERELVIRAGSKIAYLRVQPRDGNVGKKQKAVFHRPSASAKGKQYKARLLIAGDLIGTATRVYSSELPENRNAKGDEAKYFCFENIRFQNSGRYDLVMQILDEDRVLCERRVPVVVRANEPQSFELRGNFDGEIASLGGFLPSFSIVFLDANGNQTIPADSVTVKIEGEGVSVYCEGQSQPMFQFSDDDEDLYFEGDQWQVIPTKEGLIGDDPHGLVEIQFTVTVPGLDCVRKFKATFQHGAPAQMRVLSPTGRIAVENGEALPDILLGCYDDHGNRAAPLKKAWKVVLEEGEGVQLTGGRPWAPVDGTGVAAFSNLVARAVDDTNIPVDGVNVCQHFVMKLNTLQLSTTLEFTLLPDSQPRSMRLFKGDEELENVVSAPAGTQMHELSAKLYDAHGSLVAFPEDATCSVSWVKKSFRQGELPALPVPQQCRELPYDFAVRVTLPNGSELNEEFQVMVEPVEPSQWKLQLAHDASDGIACGDEADWAVKFLGVVAEDRYGNVARLTQSNTAPTLKVVWEILPAVLPDRLVKDDSADDAGNVTVAQLVPQELPLGGGAQTLRYVVPEPFALIGKRQLLQFEVCDGAGTLLPCEAKVPLVAGPPHFVRVSQGEASTTDPVDDALLVSYSLHAPIEGLTIQALDAGENPTLCPSNVQVKLVGPDDLVLCQTKVKRKQPAVTMPAFKLKPSERGMADFTAHCMLEGRVELRSNPIRFQRLKTNRVERIDILLPDAPDAIVSADDSFGAVYLDFVTEDLQPYLPQPGDVEVEIIFAKSGEQKYSKKDLAAYFDPDFKMCGLPGMDRDCFALEPAENAALAVGRYSVRVTHKESRPEFQHLDKAYLKVVSSKQLEVIAGEPQKLITVGRGLGNTTVSNSSDDERRMIGLDVHVAAADRQDNHIKLFDPVVCFLRPAAGNTQASDLPRLEGAQPDGKLRAEVDEEAGVSIFKRIALQPGVGSSDGDFELVIRTADHTHLAPIVVPLTFVSDARRLAQISAAEQQLRPELKAQRRLKHDTDKLERDARRRHDELKKLAASSRDLRSLASGVEEVTPDSLRDVLDDLCRQREQMANLRSQVPERRMPRGYPPPAVSEIRRVGVVCELGFGQTEAEVRILSAAARSLIDAVVVERTADAEQLINHGVHAWALEQIPAFSIRKDNQNRPRTEEERAHQMLPLRPFNPQIPGNPQHLVNMIKLLPTHEHLRDTVFWNIFRDSILFNDLKTAMAYRKSILERDRGARIPNIYTRDGFIVPSHGAVDPRHRIRVDQDQEFMFGQEPPESTREFEHVNSSIKFLERYIPLLEEYRKVASRLQQLRSQLVNAEKRTSSLEQELRQLGKLTQVVVSDDEERGEDDDDDDNDDAEKHDAKQQSSSKKRRESALKLHRDAAKEGELEVDDDNRRVRQRTGSSRHDAAAGDRQNDVHRQKRHRV